MRGWLNYPTCERLEAEARLRTMFPEAFPPPAPALPGERADGEDRT